jgi:hypothetical protein
LNDRAGIVVINWNGARRSAACLRSLLELDGAEDALIVLIDNGSSDGSAEWLGAGFPQIDILALPENLGYAGACNLGAEYVRRAGARYVWLLNNDTVVDRGALQAQLMSAKAAPRAIFAPKILTAEDMAVDRIWSAGGTLRWPWLDRGLRGEGAPAGDYAEACTLPWASGCSLFFSTDVMEIAGALDERYFMYLEDVDWCLSARRNGVAVRYVPQAVIWHGVSQSVRTLDARIVRYYDCRNYFLLAFRHGGAIGRAWAGLRFAVTGAKIIARTVASPASRHDAYYHAQTRALVDVVRGRWGRAPYDDGTAMPGIGYEPREAAAI